MTDIYEINLVAEIEADSYEEAIEKLDTFREAAEANTNYGIFLYLPLGRGGKR